LLVNLKIPAILFSSALLLSGCGGGGGGGSSANVAPDTPVLVAADYRTTEYNTQYGLGKINADDIYADGYSGSGVVVGVIDTGVDIDHPDLVGNIASGGYDYVSGDTDASPVSQGAVMSHGTHVAGIIAGMKNSVGMHGVAYSAKILPLRAGDSSGSFASSAIENSIDRAISQNAKVINASFGGSSISTALADKWKLAHTNDIITVHAAGNDGGSNPLLGAQLPLHSGYEDLSSTLIAVVATNSSNTITSYSNRCGSAKNWCMTAPGDGIYSTVAVDDNNYASNYGTMSGTSMADPHVAGAAAVLRGKWPSKNASEIVTILYDTATDLGAAGIDDIYGRGLLNLDNALFAQGVLTISTASGASYSLADSSIQVASNMGNSLNGLLSMSVFDKYKRDYSFDMNGVIHYASESGLVDELNYSDTNYSSATDDLQLSVNLQDNSAKMTTQLNEVNVGFAHNTLYNSENISGFSKQYSLFDNAYLSQLKGSSSIQIAKDNATLELLSGYWDADNEQAIKEVGVSFLNDFNDDFYIKARLSYLEEDETFLSNYFSNAYKTGMSKTHALSLTSSLKPTANLNIIAQYSQGNTQVDSLSDSVISDISLLKSQYYSATVLNKNVYFDDDALFFSLKHPLQITQGSLNLSLADGLNADDSISFVDRRIPITVSALSNEISLGYTANYAKNSQASVLLNRANVLGSSIQLENQLMLKMTKKF
jgi:hypothetical protein